MSIATKLTAYSVAMAAAMTAGAAMYPQAAVADGHSYKDETLKIVVRSSPGGGYDFYARLLARHIDQYLPGKPNVIVTNMSGAGGIIAANYMMHRAPRDGTEIAILARGLAITQKVEKPGVKYDVNALTSIGSMASSTWVWVLDKDHPVNTLSELRAYGKEVTFSSTGPGSGSYQRVKLLEYDSFPVKLITGYDGTDEKILAVARGDTDGTSGSYESLLGGIENEGLKVIGRMGNNPAVADKEAASDAMSKNGQALAAFMKAPMLAGRPFFGPPELPKARVKALRTAFKETLQDEKLLDEAKRADRSIGYTSAEEMEEIYASILSASPEIVGGFKGLMSVPLDDVEGKISKVEREGRILHIDGDKVRISKSRTNLLIDGKKGKRGALKAGMVCEGKAGNRKGRFEAKVLECKTQGS